MGFKHNCEDGNKIRSRMKARENGPVGAFGSVNSGGRGAVR